MKFRRKNEPEPLDDDVSVAPAQPLSGPFDYDDVAGDGTARIDLGSLLLPVQPDCEVRLQMNEATSQVLAIQIVGSDGALEVRAFAAPRHGDLWSRARAEILAEAAARGGTLEEREGRFGPELLSEVLVDTPDGQTTLASRMVGVNGDRWLLRGSFIGAPAAEPDAAAAWDDVFASVVVRRGTSAFPVGDPLPVTLPTNHPVRMPESRSGTRSAD